jgi:hypothetical protein
MFQEENEWHHKHLVTPFLIYCKSDKFALINGRPEVFNKTTGKAPNAVPYEL